MRHSTFVSVAAALSAWMLVSASSCPLIPDADERTVELALGGTSVREFHSQGTNNVIDESDDFDLGQDIDVRQILDDAGVDDSAVTDIKVMGAKVRCTRPDPNGTREVQNGTVAVSLDGGLPVLLVSQFNIAVNEATDWVDLPLQAAGVDLLNTALDRLLSNIHGGGNLPIPIGYDLTGQSVPLGTATDFLWELRLDLAITGTVTVDIYH